tara:strand:+ start:3774 stop:5009 length:1236 start_codon:yes stop_codon:yes gene_type:complete
MRNGRARVDVNQAVVLCGGLGTRLGKITKRTPKPLIKVNNKAFLDYVLLNLTRFGINEIVLLCSYKSAIFFKKYNNKKINNVKIICVKEKKLMGTYGALLNAKKKLNNFFFLLNGDTYFNVNLRDFQKKYNPNYFCSIALSKQKNISRYTAVEKNKVDTITKINTKVKKKKFVFINSGINIINKKIFNIRTLKNKSSLEKEVFPYLVKKKKIQGIYSKNYCDFIDIGVKADLKKSHNFIKTKIIKPAIFLDRDGVINEDLGYVFKKENFIWKKNIFKAIKCINDNNFYVFVVTNQSGIGRGFYNEHDLNVLHSWMNKKLNTTGAYIDDFFYSPYFKRSKKYSSIKYFNLRKPRIGMINLAKKKWVIDLKKSWVIGDQITDIKMAKNAKLKSVLIQKKDDIFKIIKKKLIKS